MSCQAFESLIALYVEGDLTERNAPRVEEHLAVCAECRELLADLRASQAAMKKLGSEAVDGALLTAIRAGVLTRIEGRRRMIWPWVGAVAAALALVAILQAPPKRPPPSVHPVKIAQRPAPPAGGADPLVRGRRPRRPSVGAASRAPVSRPGSRRLPAKERAPQLVVKMLTDDPDIVIIWLVDQTRD